MLQYWVQYLNKQQPLLKLSLFNKSIKNIIKYIIYNRISALSDRAPHNIISLSLGPLPERYNDIISISQKNYIQYAWGNIISISLKVSNKNKQKKHGVFCFFLLHCFRSLSRPICPGLFFQAYLFSRLFVFLANFVLLVLF